MAVFWNTVPYRPVEIDRCFAGVYFLHYQGAISRETIIFMLAAVRN
jgi:hypothetical protein